MERKEIPKGFGGCNWDTGQKYPDTVKIIMTDDESVEYVPKVVQPRFLETAIGIIRKWNNGYPKHTKK